MKTQGLLFVGLLLFFLLEINNNKVVAQDNTATKNSIRIVSSPDLLDITSSWAKDYKTQNPEVTIELIDFTDSKIENILTVDANLRFVSNEYFTMLNNKDLWKMTVGKDVLVPILNSKNPVLSELQKQIVTPKIIGQILKNSDNRIWNVVSDEGKTVAVNYYKVNSPAANTRIGKYLSIKKNMVGTEVTNEENLISAIQNDPYAIGFCTLSSLMNSNSTSNISIMPFDRNGNNQIDDFENTYCDMEAYLSKSCPGEFPKELTGYIYSVATETPTNQADIAFLKYISTDGQKQLDQKGYISLNYIEKQSNLNNFGFTDEVKSSTSLFTYFSLRNTLILIGILLISIVVLLIEPFKKKATTNLTINNPEVLTQKSITIPMGLQFDKSHTWAYMEKDGLVGIGIDDFLQHIVGKITKIKMSDTGTKIKKGEPILTIIQEGKQLVIKSPISGTIKSQNEELISNTSWFQHSPFDKAWVYKIEPTNWLVEIQFLFMSKKYQEWLKDEFTRLKEFFTVYAKPEMKEYALILQDGGEIKDGILTDMEPEVWEDFQTHFIDSLNVNPEK